MHKKIDTPSPHIAEVSYGSQDIYRPFPEAHNLPKNELYTIQTGEQQPGITPTIATLYLNRSEHVAEDPRGIDIIDLRGANRSADGSVEYGGQVYSGNLQYLLMQPLSFDVDEQRGFKGLRNSEAFIFGRGNQKANERFIQGPDVSRQHVMIRVTADGDLQFIDTSTNGTSLVEYAPEPKKSFAPPRIARKALGHDVIMHQETESKAEMIIAHNLDVMRSNEFGGLRYSMGTESIGGNAGVSTIDGERYANSASNGYIDNEGNILLFANPQEIQDGVLPKNTPIHDIGVIVTHARIKSDNGSLRILTPKTWRHGQDHQITRVIVRTDDGNDMSLHDAVKDGVITERAAQVLNISIKRYNTA